MQWTSWPGVWYFLDDSFFVGGIGLLDHRSLVQYRCWLVCLHLLSTYFIGGRYLAVDSLLLMFYRLGFSSIDGNVVLDHRSLVQVCRPYYGFSMLGLLRVFSAPWLNLVMYWLGLTCFLSWREFPGFVL